MLRDDTLAHLIDRRAPYGSSRPSSLSATMLQKGFGAPTGRCWRLAQRRCSCAPSSDRINVALIDILLAG
jgi:hypothetical protein